MKNRTLPKLTLLFSILLFTAYVIFYKINYVEKTYGFEVERDASNFQLRDKNNASIALVDFKNKKIFLFFGYTRCKNSCQASIGVFKNLSKKITSTDTVFIFVSIDPDRDTPESISKFSDYFDERFYLLTGKKKELRQIALDYEVFIDQENDSTDNYEINHTGHIFFIDTNQKIRRIYPSNFTDIDKIIKDYNKISSSI